MVSEQRSIENAIRGEAPAMETPLPSLVNLQRGILDPESGEWQTEAEVRELTGADEEYLSALESKASTTYAEYMTALLKRTVIRVGTIDITASPNLVEQFIIGDRDNLFMGILKCTYGQTREYTVRCSECAKVTDVEIDLDEDFPRQETSVDLQSPLEAKLRNGKVVKLRLPNGADSAYVGKHSSSTPVQNTLMLSRCAILSQDDLGGKTPEEWAKQLSLSDRGKLVKTILDVKIGPKLEGVNVQCAHCEADMPLNLNWMSLLFG